LITIVLPAFNEEPFIGATVAELLDGTRARRLDVEIVIVENGSSDGTLAAAERLAENEPEVRALSRPEPDYGAALKHGFDAARGDMVVNFDVDYFDLEFLDRALAILEAGDAVMVVASKRGEGAHDTRGLPRRTVTAVFGTVLRHAFKLKTIDTHGMKAMHRAAVAPLVTACKMTTDLYDTELVMRIERAGLNVAAVPVVVEERRASRTSIVRRIPRSVNGLGRLWLQFRRESRQR
jgi:glycosyltransferase involved in cell wall biosynthesis